MASERPTADSLPREPLARLLAVMAWLRDRQHGCPWDIEQTFRTIAPYTIEEAYEVADAIERDDLPALKEELGDLLLQVVYHAQMAQRDRRLRLRRRGRRPLPTRWSTAIRTSSATSRSPTPRPRPSPGRPARRPSARPRRRTRRRPVPSTGWRAPSPRCCGPRRSRSGRPGSASTGRNTGPVIDKIEEELGELRAELEAGTIDQARLTDELGDVLFAVANLARHCKVDPEAALRATNDKFERRFRHIERRLAEAGRKPADASLEEMEALWQEAKTRV